MFINHSSKAHQHYSSNIYVLIKYLAKKSEPCIKIEVCHLCLVLTLALSDPWLKDVLHPNLLSQALLKSRLSPSLHLLSQTPSLLLLQPPLVLLPPPLPLPLILHPLIQPKQEPPCLLPLKPLRKAP